MTTVAKEKVVNPLDTLLAKRRKEGVEVIAPKIVELVSSVGVRNAFGYVLSKDAVHFEYNELSGMVIATLGSQEMFAANVETGKCSLYRAGSWIRMFEDIYNNSIAGQDTDLLRQRHELKFRENFGLPY
jgi:hypothetical protein